MKQHTHLHLNVQRTMTRAKVTADLDKAFRLRPHTLGVCEMETPWHLSEFRRLAALHGYTVATWTGAAGALALAVRDDYGTLAGKWSTFAAPGSKGLSPNRYANRIVVHRHEDRQTVHVLEHHAWSSGWTGSKVGDTLRRARWYVGMAVVSRIERKAGMIYDVAVGGGDLNRPPQTWAGGKALWGVLAPKGYKSTGYVKTDGTHGSSLILDFVWFLSSRHVVRVESWSTPTFNSDHDGILTTLSW